jgi:hypothetical protein
MKMIPPGQVDQGKKSPQPDKKGPTMSAGDPAAIPIRMPM